MKKHDDDDIASVEDIAAIATDIKAQLMFFRDIGFSDIGGSLPRQCNTPPQSAVQTSGLPAPSESSVEAISLVDPDPATGPAGATFSPELRSEADRPAPNQLNLFGEVVSQPIGLLSSKTRTAADHTFSFAEGPVDRSLEDIRNDIGECTRCRLHEQRTNIVFGEGNPAAQLVFVGEGPGADEDRTGRPFVGKAGRLLDKIIEAMDMNREDVYIANVVKCRPPDNRTPERDEAATCSPFLLRQLAFIRPKVIVALGAPALQCLTGSREGITRARGHWQEWRGIKVMPTYHPAYLLRVPDKKKETWEDMKRVRDYILNEGGFA